MNNLDRCGVGSVNRPHRAKQASCVMSLAISALCKVDDLLVDVVYLMNMISLCQDTG